MMDSNGPPGLERPGTVAKEAVYGVIGIRGRVDLHVIVC